MKMGMELPFEITDLVRSRTEAIDAATDAVNAYVDSFNTTAECDCSGSCEKCDRGTKAFHDSMVKLHDRLSALEKLGDRLRA